MQILGFIGRVSTQVEQTANAVGQILKNKVAACWSSVSLFLIRAWQHEGHALYERNIKPLQKVDYALLLGALASIPTIAAIAVKKWGVAALPISFAAGGSVVWATWSFSRSRIRWQFNETAWSHVDQIRRNVHGMTRQNQNFDEIYRLQGLLKKPEFSNSERDMELIDGEIGRFRDALATPSFEEEKEKVLAHLADVKILVAAHAADRGVIEALEQEINAQAPTLTGLETRKQNLQQLQTAEARLHLTELNQQINVLINAFQKPKLANQKESLLRRLTNLQEKLDYSKEIPAL